MSHNKRRAVAITKFLFCQYVVTTIVQIGSSSTFRQWNRQWNSSSNTCLRLGKTFAIARVLLKLWLESFCFHALVIAQIKCHSLLLIRQRALRKRNFVVMEFVMKVLWQDHTFVLKCKLNALCLLSLDEYTCIWIVKETMINKTANFHQHSQESTKSCDILRNFMKGLGQCWFGLMVFHNIPWSHLSAQFLISHLVDFLQINY